MAITDIQISEELQTGAPSIKYRGNEGPKAPMEMAMSDPMLIEEYEKYVYSMQEQGQEPVSFEQFVQEIMSGMAKGGRAGYGLGSLVRSITRPVKKFVKSDAGKAALMGATMFGLPGTQFGGLLGRASFGGAAPSIFGKTGGIGAFFKPGSYISKNIDGPIRHVTPSRFSQLISKFPGGLSGAALTAATALPFTGIGMGDEETIDMNLPDSQKFDQSYSQMRKDIGDAISSGVKENFTEVLNKYDLTEGVDINYWEDIRKPSAQGGRIGYANGGSNITLSDGTIVQIPAGSIGKYGLKDRIYESSKGSLLREDIIPLLNPGLTFNQGGKVPAKKKKKKYKRQGMEFDYPLGPEGTFNTLNPPKRYEVAEGGIMDLGGMEKDYRETGGFVDLGAKEKADDVPARLSVNEFVFTADAVRGAGGGDIDKGAEIMENVMKNLEEGGRISEKSQGLTNRRQGASDMFEVSERLSEVV